ncbi:MAG TPA: hypothetical protein VFQ76_12195 [Longimicrobiaceae bacterium]|nr:hypothetical protein [Longimicrobiaceae bacterium]
MALNACQDVGTLPDDLATTSPSPAVESRAVLEGVVPGPLEYACYTSLATPGGRHAYRYGRILLHFPTEAIHPARATHRYRYQMVTRGGKVLRVANCVIPRSDRAVEMMNRRFAVPQAEGELSLQGCVSNGVCTLEPIVVIGDGSSGGGGAGGGGGSGGGGGGGGGDGGDFGPGGGECLTSAGDLDGVQGCGGGGEAPDPGDPYAWDDGTGRPACERDANGLCITRDLTADEWTRLGAAIEAIRENPAECKGAKDALRGLFAQGPQADRFRLWDGYDKYWDEDLGKDQQRVGQNLSDVQGRYIEYDSYWVWNDPTLVVHEGLHLWLYQTNSPLMGKANEDWVTATAPNCV